MQSTLVYIVCGEWKATYQSQESLYYIEKRHKDIIELLKFRYFHVNME